MGFTYGTFHLAHKTSPALEKSDKYDRYVLKKNLFDPCFK